MNNTKNINKTKSKSNSKSNSKNNKTNKNKNSYNKLLTENIKNEKSNIYNSRISTIQKEKTRILDYKEVFGEHRKGEDQPIGTKKINYDLLFNKDEMYVEEEEPIKVKRKKNSNYKHEIHKKKIVYDARKAIEQAKIKEATEEKKEKPSAFREFIKEMRKVNCEEKELKKNKGNEKENENDKDSTDNNIKNKIENKVIRINRNKKLSKQVESFFDENDLNEINAQTTNIMNADADTQDKLPNEENNDLNKKRSKSKTPRYRNSLCK